MCVSCLSHCIQNLPGQTLSRSIARQLSGWLVYILLNLCVSYMSTFKLYVDFSTCMYKIVAIAKT